MRKAILALAALAVGMYSYAQSIELSGATLSPTMLKDGTDHEYGNGSLQKYKARVSMPVYYRKDSLGRVNLWSLTASGSLGVLNNRHEAQYFTPHRIMNTSLSATHIMPLSQRWYMVGSLGAGVYAEPSHVRWNTVVVRGAAIFARHCNTRLDAGLGASFTTLYGAPIFLPAVLVKYNDASYSLELNVLSGANVTGGARLSKALTLKLTAFDWETMPAIIKRDGRSRVYSSMMLRSYFEPELHFARKSWLSAQVGYNYHRSATIKKRVPGSFMGHVDDEKNRHFSPSLLLGATLHAGL